jgi:hypothetical protein
LFQEYSIITNKNIFRTCLVIYCCFSTTDVILLPPAVDSGVRVTRSLVLCECFVDCCLSFCPVFFDHCVACSSSIYWFWLPFWYLQTLFYKSGMTDATGGAGTVYRSWAHECAPGFLWGSCFTIFIFLFILSKIIVCPFITYPLAIELLDLLRFAASDNPFGSFKHFFLWQTWYI